ISKGLTASVGLTCFDMRILCLWGFRLLVTLKAGEEIALHVNPGFGQKPTVPNTLLKHSWGKEDLSPSTMLGPSFEICIYCDARCFKVATKGRHRFDCTSGVPSLQQVDMLEIGGDVTLTQALV
uniref:Galectin n=1 Tax=Aquila chrysaetos chrysaetos TaxID=223781 RepID=A0A663EJ77_AQUCH